MVEITLSPEKLALANAEACRRQQENEAKGLRGRNKAPDKGEKALKLHRLGCIGEVAVAEYLGLQEHLFSAESAVRGSEDLPGNIEVKTRSKHSYDLLVQFSDDPGKIFVLATHEGGSMTQIRGWIRGCDAMRKEWVREFVRGRPCYAVPQAALSPASTIKDSLATPVTNRPTETHEVWLTEDGDDIILNFSETILSKLKWKEGDLLQFDTVSEPSQCIIKKVNEHAQVINKSYLERVFGHDGSI